MSGILRWVSSLFSPSPPPDPEAGKTLRTRPPRGCSHYFPVHLCLAEGSITLPGGGPAAGEYITVDVQGTECVVQSGSIGGSAPESTNSRFLKHVNALVCAAQAIHEAQQKGYRRWWYSAERYDELREQHAERRSSNGKRRHSQGGAPRAKRAKLSMSFGLEDFEGSSYQAMCAEVKRKRKQIDHREEKEALVELQSGEYAIYLDEEALGEWADEERERGNPEGLEQHIPFKSAFSKRVTMSKCGIAVVDGDWDDLTPAGFAVLQPELQALLETFKVVQSFRHGVKCSEGDYPIIPVVFRDEDFPWSGWFRENATSGVDFGIDKWHLDDEYVEEELVGFEMPQDLRWIKDSIEEALWDELEEAFRRWGRAYDWDSECPPHDLINPNPVVAFSHAPQVVGSLSFKVGFITAGVWT